MVHDLKKVIVVYITFFQPKSHRIEEYNVRQIPDKIFTIHFYLQVVMYDSYLLKDVHSVLVNFPREYAQESMMFTCCP